MFKNNKTIPLIYRQMAAVKTTRGENMGLGISPDALFIAKNPAMYRRYIARLSRKRG
jgi:hypothetical protein